MKVIIEDDDKKMIYVGDNPSINMMLYHLMKLTFSEVDFTLYHSTNREYHDLETFNDRKTIKRINHDFRFETD